MRVAIITWGSRGDYQPYLALAAVLQKAGHEVRMTAPNGPLFDGIAKRFGVDVVFAGPPVESQVVEEAIEEIDYTKVNPVTLVRMTLDHLLAPETWGDMFDCCVELARWSDVVVSHFLQVTGRMAAEAAEKPWVSSTLVPTQIPTDSRAPGGKAHRWRFLNRRAWKRAIGFMNSAWLPPVNAARQRAGLPPLDDLAVDGFYSSRLNLVAASPTVFPQPRDWGPQHQMTGYWRPDEVGDWEPSPELEEFMARGPAPICIGFGSMPSKDPEGLSRTVHDVVDRLAVRAIIEPGMALLSAVDDPMTIHPANLPHTWLLPRVRAIVHHGGAGTTAAALDFGVPQVIVPHLYDQHFWAERTHQLGVAPRPLPIDSLSADRLASAISRVLSEKRFDERAKKISEAIAQEGGTRNAISLIEKSLEYERSVGEATPTFGGSQ